MGDADGKQAAGKAFYDRARRIHQNDHDAKLYTSLGAAFLPFFDFIP